MIDAGADAALAYATANKTPYRVLPMALPPGQGAQDPTDAQEGPGGIHPSATVWNRARRRVIIAGATTPLMTTGGTRGVPVDRAPDLSLIPR